MRFVVYQFAQRKGRDAGAVEVEIAQFQAKTGRYARERIWQTPLVTDPITWWKAYGLVMGNQLSPLAEIGVLLAQFPASIAAVERGNKVVIFVLPSILNQFQPSNIMIPKCFVSPC